MALLRPLAFLAFVAVTVVAFYFSEHTLVRRGYVVGFVAVLVVASATGVAMFPAVTMHKFADTVDEESTYHEFRIADESGTEIEYDQRASAPVIGTRHASLALATVEEYDDEKRLEIAAFLLEQAIEHRTDVESGPSFSERVRYPRHMHVEGWSATELEDVGEFDRLVIYERTVRYDDDAGSIENRSERKLLEIDPDEERIEGPAA
ncbi:hypothetical protein [Saliphagus sp. LR7]|uniref:hypothetical protein n=1 Tax=Saliphagus sp. LR7 TaxID=2282654 RepID=UPI000DF75257|nr:hypothetical protein [Saliphagus sp. LR7]